MSSNSAHPWTDITPYRVNTDQVIAFRRDGYLVVRNLLLEQHVREVIAHAEDLLHARVTLPGVPPVVAGESPRDREKKLLRVHMGHYDHELWERYLLYPRLLDVLEVLQGPDILAMQTMLFIKGPGSNGQGFHQDSYYIPTFPDTLIGAWVALDPADRENGCLWVAKDSHFEPIYPPLSGHGYGETLIDGITKVEHVGGHSNDDEDPLNTLKPIAERYEQVPIDLSPGDVVFFGGHVFHRSLRNRSEHRYRRSLVNHYCNARSFTTWGGGNSAHILARGNSHLPFRQPRFGTPCAALCPRPSLSDSGAVPTMMMATEDGMMMAQVPAMSDHDD